MEFTFQEKTYSLDFSPLDSFLWGFLKNAMHSNDPHALKELQSTQSAYSIGI
jgi:hypothetical protein